VSTLISIYLLYHAGLFAESALNAYYVVMSCYGWWYWIKKKHEQAVPVSWCTRSEWKIVLIIIAIAWILLTILLKQFTNSNVPVLDAWVSATAWAGMWLLAKRKIENWIILNISNLFAIPLLFYKQLPLFAGLTIFLFVVAIFGFYDWKKSFNKTNQQMPHPSEIIEHALADRMRSFSMDAEKSGQLHPEQIGLIRQNNWLNLFVPKQYGGLELALPEALRIEEALAWVDGSMGWTLTLCSGAAWFVGFLDPGFAKQLFADPLVCLAGSGRATGIATIIDGGYMVSGSWNYASGAPFATAFTANCLIEKDGLPLLQEDGSQAIRSFVF